MVSFFVQNISDADLYPKLPLLLLGESEEEEEMSSPIFLALNTYLNV
jgi:hypothetical protein